jgi:undecaprenyl diphosphate synthase
MHVAIIMNGNGRWALQRGLPPTGGHREGAAALRTTVELALRAGIKTLTVYAIVEELDANLRALGGYLRSDSARCAQQAVRISVIGDCKRLGAALLRIPESEATARPSRLHLRIVIDYSEHDGVVRSSWCDARTQAPENFEQRLREIDHTALPAGAVDLLIRTGGPKDPRASGMCRSHFMLWEVAYARLHYAECLWPDFSAHHFQRALGYPSGDERLSSGDRCAV